MSIRSVKKEEVASNDPLENVEVEQVLLGTILRDEFYFDKVAPYCEWRFFYDPFHQRIFEAMRGMRDTGAIITPLTVRAEMRDDPAFSEVGTGYLNSLGLAAPLLPNVREYARILRDLFLRRQIEATAQDAAAMARRTDVTPQAAMRDFVDLADYATELGSLDEGHVHPGDAAMMLVEEIDNAKKGLADAPPKTGIAVLDDFIGGLYPGNLIVIAGRPGMGKSALAGQLALNVAKAGRAVEYFSREMSQKELALRMACALDYELNPREKPIAYESVLHGRASEPQIDRVMHAAVQLRKLPITIHDKDQLTMQQIAALSRSRAARAKPGLIIIDHLHILDASDRYRGNRVQELSEMTKQAKGLAKRLDVPVALLSQLNRELEKRPEKDRRPTLSDLRESGSIEQDADVVIGLYRPAYYLEQSAPAKGTPERDEWRTSYQEKAHELEVIVLKRRMGRSGAVQVYCDMRASVVCNPPDAVPADDQAQGLLV